MAGYDIIGDIHGCANTLQRLLDQMGYRKVNGVYRHPKRQAIFIGDIIDRGPRIREALHLVRDMVEHGAARIVMGNHEYNALGYCTRARPGSGKQFLREHNPRHDRLIKETLEQFDAYPPEHAGTGARGDDHRQAVVEQVELCPCHLPGLVHVAGGPGRLAAAGLFLWKVHAAGLVVYGCLEFMITRSITVLGATGSIGLSTLDVIRRHPERFSVHALTAGTRAPELAALCREFRPRVAVMADAGAAEELAGLLADCFDIDVLSGEQGLIDVAAAEQADTVMASIVGAAGLAPTLAAVCAGKRVLLANKEALVMSGQLFMDAVAESGAELLPIDSEHNAIFQCMPADKVRDPQAAGITRILLTASGGPFRTLPAEQLRSVTPAQACAHPNWSMGQKISVDSATLMNKGLELIEACWLFNTSPDKVEVHVHPESIIHSMVEYADGSVLAQLGSPDMRTPIANGLAWPERIEAGVAPLDLFAIGRFHFERPDLQRFPCLRLAAEAFATGGTAPAVLNAANEVAVAAFLEGGLCFADIPVIIERTMAATDVVSADSFDTIFRKDAEARERAMEQIRLLSV